MIQGVEFLEIINRLTADRPAMSERLETKIHGDSNSEHDIQSLWIPDIQTIENELEVYLGSTR